MYAKNPRYPFGPADVQNVTSAANVALTLTNGGLTYVKFSQMTANMALTVAVPEDMPQGAMLYLELPSDSSARNVTPGTGFTSAALPGTGSKTKVASFIFVGDKFVNTGLTQID